MKNRFAYALSGSFIFIVFVFAAVCLGYVLYTFFGIFGVLGLGSYSIVMDIVALILSATFLTLLVFILTASYKIQDGTVKLKLGFWDVSSGKFKVEKVIKLVKATNTGKLYMNVYVGDNAQIVLINIRTQDTPLFTDTMKKQNPHILYEEAEITE